AGREGKVTVRMTLDKKPADVKVDLSGDPVQRVDVPLTLGKPGKIEVSVTMLDDAGKEIFAEARKGSIPPPLAVSPPSPTHWCVEDGEPIVEAWVDVAIPDEQRDGAKLQLRLEDAAGKSRPGDSTDLGVVASGTNHLTIKSEKPLPPGDYKLIAEL